MLQSIYQRLGLIESDIADLELTKVSVNTFSALQNSVTLPATGLLKETVLRFKEGETWKVCYFNGYYKTAEIVIKDRSYLRLSLKSDSGVDLTLNTFAIDFINEAWVFGTDLYIFSNGTIRSNFNNQDGLTVQFGRDVIGNAYQFTITKIS